MNRAQCNETARGQLHDEGSQRGCREEESKAVLEKRLTKMDAAGVKRNLEGCALQDIAVGDRGQGGGLGYHYAIAG